MIVKTIVHGIQRGRSRAKDGLFFALSTFLLVMITIFLIVQAIFGEEMWIVNEGYPGGSAQYFADHSAVWYQTFGSAAGVAINAVSDAVLVSPLCVRGLKESLNVYSLYDAGLSPLYRLGPQLICCGISGGGLPRQRG